GPRQPKAGRLPRRMARLAERVRLAGFPSPGRKTCTVGRIGPGALPRSDFRRRLRPTGCLLQTKTYALRGQNASLSSPREAEPRGGASETEPRNEMERVNLKFQLSYFVRLQEGPRPPRYPMHH